MSSANRRLDKLESNLTPKQAALLWMAEAHKVDTLEGYALLSIEPKHAPPILFHIHDVPAFGLGFIKCFLQVTDN